MIRFACPGCSAVMSVGDEKAGKTGKCPKCQTAFVIPAPEAGSSEPPPLPESSAPPPLPEAVVPPSPPPVDAAVEIKPCPGCQGRLTVSPEDVGTDVECPYCKTVFRAKRAVSDAPVPPPAPPRKSDLETTDESGRPRRPRDEDDDRPRRKRRDDDDEDDRPSSRWRRDDDEDARPRRRRVRRRENYEPHRGTMILVFGCLSWVVCVIFGIIAWVMASQDLRKMDNGEMDPEGRGLTQAGRVIGMIHCILNVVVFLGFCVLFAFGGMGGKGR